MKEYLDFRNNIEYEKLKEMGETIQKGEIVIFPTETVYAIGTNGLDEEAIRKLYKIKQRPFDKPTSLLVSDMKMVEALVADITDKEYKLMKTFFPGPLTIILKNKNIVKQKPKERKRFYEQKSCSFRWWNRNVPSTSRIQRLSCRNYSDYYRC